MTVPMRPVPALARAAALALLAVACSRSDGQPPDARDAAAAPADSAAVAPLERARADRARFRDATLDAAALARVVDSAVTLPKLRSLLVARRDTLLVERYVHGAAADRLANLKSASKSVVSTLVGIAIAEGHLRGTDQPLAELLPDAASGLDSVKRAITLGDLVSMRAGLQSTSFEGYGAWVTSRNWVRAALARPVVAPAGHAGGPMIYSTGNTHLLSAALTRATRASTYAYAQRALARPLGIRLRPWATDPQGIYFGGNEMLMTPREMLRFGALYLREGRAPADAPEPGKQIVPRAWIDSSWVPRGRSGWSGEEYGYGWWIRTAPGRRDFHRVYFAWGYGGQYVFVVPSLELVVVITSDPEPSRRDGAHLRALHGLLDSVVVAAGG
jgi:CubicO group peptidase (beta-lactamase class C family)